MFSNQSAGFPQPLHYSSAFHFGNTIEVPNTMTATNNDNPYPHVAWLPMHAAQTITHNAHLPFPYSNHLPLRFAPPNNGSIRMHDDSNDSRIGSFLQCPAPPNHITTPLSMSFKPTQCASVSLSTSNNKALNCKTVAQLNQPRLHHKNFHLIGDKVEEKVIDDHSGIVIGQKILASRKKCCFKCIFCKEEYPSFSKLQRHSRRHTGYQPYKCGICSTMFTQKASLKQHLLRHNIPDLLRHFHCPSPETYTIKSSLILNLVGTLLSEADYKPRTRIASNKSSRLDTFDKKFGRKCNKIQDENCRYQKQDKKNSENIPTKKLEDNLSTLSKPIELLETKGNSTTANLPQDHCKALHNCHRSKIQINEICDYSTNYSSRAADKDYEEQFSKHRQMAGLSNDEHCTKKNENCKLQKRQKQAKIVKPSRKGGVNVLSVQVRQSPTDQKNSRIERVKLRREQSHTKIVKSAQLKRNTHAKNGDTGYSKHSKAARKLRNTLNKAHGIFSHPAVNISAESADHTAEYWSSCDNKQDPEKNCDLSASDYVPTSKCKVKTLATYESGEPTQAFDCLSKTHMEWTNQQYFKTIPFHYHTDTRGSTPVLNQQDLQYHDMGIRIEQHENNWNDMSQLITSSKPPSYIMPIPGNPMNRPINYHLGNLDTQLHNNSVQIVSNIRDQREDFMSFRGAPCPQTYTDVLAWYCGALPDRFAFDQPISQPHSVNVPFNVPDMLPFAYQQPHPFMAAIPR